MLESYYIGEYEVSFVVIISMVLLSEVQGGWRMVLRCCIHWVTVFVVIAGWRCGSSKDGEREVDCAEIIV
jgi:hypothetical protein